MKGWRRAHSAGHVPSRRVEPCELTTAQREVVLDVLEWLGAEPVISVSPFYRLEGRESGKSVVVETIREYDRQGYARIRDVLRKEGRIP